MAPPRIWLGPGIAYLLRGGRVVIGTGMDILLRQDLLGKAVAEGDVVAAVRADFYGRPLRFRVKRTEPAGTVRIAETTQIAFLEAEAEKHRGWPTRLLRRFRKGGSSGSDQICA